MTNTAKRLLAVSVLSFVGTTRAFTSIGVIEPALSRRDVFRAATATGLISALLSIATSPASAETDISQFKDGPRGLKYLVISEQERRGNNEAATCAKGQDELLLMVSGRLSRRWRKGCQQQ